MKSKLNKLIERRDNVTNQIMNYWRIVRTENVVKRGYRRNYDLKALLKEIKKLGEERMTLKAKILCGNLGLNYKDFDKDCMQMKIFELSEVNEYYAQLAMIETIPTGLKIKQGKKNLMKTEVMTADYIKGLRKQASLNITALKKKMTDYNEKTEVDDVVVMSLVA